MNTAALRERVRHWNGVIDPLPGRCLPESGSVLYQLVRRLQAPMRIAVLRAGAERSLLWLAAGLADHAPGGELLAIERWGAAGVAQRSALEALLAASGLGRQVRLCDDAAALAGEGLAPQPFDIVLLEPAPDFAAALADAEAYARHVAPGGLLVLGGIAGGNAARRLATLLPRWWQLGIALPDHWIYTKSSA